MELRNASVLIVDDERMLLPFTCLASRSVFATSIPQVAISYRVAEEGNSFAI